MPNVFIIKGTNNTRKSSTIRALTGAGQRGKYQISTNLGDIDVFVQISALQEANILPDEFIIEIDKIDCNTVLVPLHVRGRSIRGRNNGLDYINAFINAKWKINGIGLFGTTIAEIDDEVRLPNNLPYGIIELPNSPNQPANRTAHELRKQWGWL